MIISYDELARDKIMNGCLNWICSMSPIYNVLGPIRTNGDITKEFPYYLKKKLLGEFDTTVGISSRIKYSEYENVNSTKIIPPIGSSVGRIIKILNIKEN